MRKGEPKSDYNKRMNALSRRISNVLDDEDLAEVAFACIAISAFSITELPTAEQREEAKRLAISLFNSVLERK